MNIRKYTSSDCPALAKLFYDTIHAVNARDYTQEQLDAWADGNIDLDKWNQSLSAHHTFVAVQNGEIVGFGDIDETGYLDRLFVHKDHQGEGIASAICSRLEQAVQGCRITTEASVTARPFFERRGYRVVKKQQVRRQDILLTNYVMEK